MHAVPSAESTTVLDEAVPPTPPASAPPGAAPGSPPGLAPGLAPELAGESDAELLALTASLERERRRTEGLLIRRLMEIEHRRLHVEDGYRDIAGWGRGTRRWSDREARARRNLVALSATCPQVLERLLTGRLGVAQAHLIGRISKAPRVGRFVPLFIDDILDAAGTFDYSDFELYLKEWKLRVDPDGADPARAHAERQASIGFSDHEFRLVVTGPNLDGAKLKALLDEFERAEFDADWAACVAEYGDDARPDLMRRTAEKRRYDAFLELLAHVELPDDGDDVEPDDLDEFDPFVDAPLVVEAVRCSRDDDPSQAGRPGAAEATDVADRAGSADSPASAGGDAPTVSAASDAVNDTNGRGAGGAGSRVRRRRRERSADGAVVTTVNIVIDLRTFLDGLNQIFGGATQRHLRSPFAPDRAMCHTLDGVLVSARDAVLAALYGTTRLVVTDDDGRPMQMTSRQRLFTGRLRQALLMLAVRCTHPGCNHPSTSCEGDHVVPWSEGGTTSLDNADPGCRRHNLWRYVTGARVRRRANGSWATHRADGSEIAPPC